VTSGPPRARPPAPRTGDADMRHGTTIALAALLLLIVVAAVVQLSQAASL